jgi:hypothetical protein
MYRVGWLFKSNNMGSLMAAATQGIAMWKEAGCMEAALWGIDGSSPGMFAFAVTCESAEKFYQIDDAMQNNPEFMQWQMSWANMFEFMGNFRVQLALDMSSEHLESPEFMVQWHFVPSSMETMMEAAQAGAEIWKRHGAKQVMLTSMAGSGVGQFAFAMAFENGAQFGALLDKVSQDEDWMAWQGKYSNTSTWTGNIYGRKLMG